MMHSALSKVSFTHFPTSLSIQPHNPPIYIRLPRGGGGAAAIDLLGDGSLDNLQDEDIDRMVEDLIAGVDENDGEGSEEEEDGDGVANLMDEGDFGSSNVDDDVSDQDESAEVSDNESADASESNSSHDTVAAVRATDTSNLPTQKHIQGNGNPHAHINSQSRPSSTRKSRQIKSDTLPTNAYYRFLVRRGPKGHVLASFSLLSIQWIYTYLPFLYKFAASILLTLRIYDPNLLHIKERERLQKDERRRNKVSFTDKLRGTFSNNSGSKKKQREDDQEATSKLQQLYKTAKTAALDWKEIRYSYLSVDFRRRHGLGGDYVKKKPLKFMGESVGGELILENDHDDEVVIDEEGLSLDDLEQVDGVERQTMLGQTKKKQQKRKRKITDWVVQSFANQHFASSTGKSKANDSSVQSPNVSPSLASMWKSAQKDAILNAAWESRNAEKSIWANDNKDMKSSSGKSDMHQYLTIRDKSSNLSSAGASKMFQSVMTRVGSNGRLLGAYPMDALPIEECCNRKGVIELARRYGYGDWNVNENWEETESDDELLWGVGDLLLEKDEKEDVHDVSTPRHGSKSGRKKKRQTTDDSDEVSSSTKKSKSRRRRKKTQQRSDFA